MAPTPVIAAFVDMYTSHDSSRQLLPRAVPSDSLTATIIVVSVVSTLLFASMVFLLCRVWKGVISKRIDSQLSEAPKDQTAAPARKQSDWARKNSNVLWSMYIEEEDLKAQFAVSPKSRLFSIGSVSTIDPKYPLDRRQSHASPLSQHTAVNDSSSKTDDSGADLRNRTPYDHQTTPTKNIPRARALSQPSKHRYTNSFEELAERKQSLPVRIEESVN